jgi:hypothetical protein
MRKKQDRLWKSTYWRFCWIGVSLTICKGIALGGIPEPSFLMYGVIRNNLSGANVRLTSGTLTWKITNASGSSLTLQTTLTNINDQFSYALPVPLESPMSGIDPDPQAFQLTATAVRYSRAQVYVDGTAAFIVSPATNTFSLSQRDRGKFERVDLQVQLAFVDSDHDGLPDSWENTYFGGHCAPDADSDDDGLSNREEYLAGTDPKSSKSSIEFVETEKTAAGGMVLRWQSATNRFYRILRSHDLLSGFSPIAAGIRATPPVNIFTDTNTVDRGPYFYQVDVE